MSYFFIINHSIDDRTKEGRKEKGRKKRKREGGRERKKGIEKVDTGVDCIKIWTEIQMLNLKL